MTHQPTPAPKQPRPIKGPGDHAGQLRVVISFRQTSIDASAEDWREWWTWRLHHIADKPSQQVTIADLDVGVSVIGAAGERVEDEGTWEPAGSANLDEVEFGDPRPINNIQAKKGRP